MSLLKSSATVSNSHALIAIYVAQGFQYADKLQHGLNLDSIGGHIGAMEICTNWAGKISQILCKLNEVFPDLKYPGVFEYEAAELIGMDIHDNLNEPEKFKAQIESRIIEFFYQFANAEKTLIHNSHEKPPLMSKLISEILNAPFEA